MMLVPGSASNRLEMGGLLGAEARRVRRSNRWIRLPGGGKVAPHKGGGMRGRVWMLFVGLLLTVVRMPGVAQESEPDARTVLQAALRAMGGENLKSITYSGT